MKALTLGFKMDRIQGERSRKGMYGLGMKTAAASLGRVWEIWTRHADSKMDYYARFDLEEFKTRWSRNQKDLWKLDLVSLDRASASPLGNLKSGNLRVLENKELGKLYNAVGL